MASIPHSGDARQPFVMDGYMMDPGRGRDFVLAAAYSAAAIVGTAAAYVVGPTPPVVLTAVLASIAFAVEKRTVSLTGRLRVSATFLPIVLALALGGPASGVVVSALAFLAHMGRPYVRWVVWTAAAVLCASVAGVASWPLHPHPTQFADVLLVSSVAGAITAGLSLILATATVAIRRGPWLETFLASWGLTAGAATVYVPMVAALGYAYSRGSIWALIGAIFPLIALQQLLVLYLQQRQTAHRLVEAVAEAEAVNQELESRNAELRTINLSFAASLIVSLDARDHYTAGHSAAVAVYSRDLAAALGWEEEEQALAYLAGLMHDIGKVGLPPGILEKAAPLSAEEEVAMQQHVLIGERILGPVQQFRPLAPAIRHHHEHYDGRGYPDALRGEEIPTLARVVAVADSYNAMTSNRPYRGAMAPDAALDQLRAVAGTQLDPVFAPTLCAVVSARDASYAVARTAEFVVEFDRLSAAATPLVAAF